MLPSQFLFHKINEIQFYINFRCLWTTHVWFNPWEKRAVGTQVHSGIFWEMQALWTCWYLVYRIWSYKQRYCHMSSFLITITKSLKPFLTSLPQQSWSWFHFFFILNLFCFAFCFDCSVVMLWPYQSLDDRTKIRKEAQGLEEWVEASKANMLSNNFVSVS